MPNWVTNHVHLECENEDTILKINEFLKSEERDIDFNNIVEMPEVMRTTESGSRTDDAWDYYQAKILGNKAPMENRLEWPWVKREGLKTIEELMDYLLKRDPDILKTGEELYEIHKEFGCHDWYTWACHYWGTKWNACESSTEDTELYFNTAWSGVPQLIQKLSCLFPTVTMYYGWADEDFGYNVGRIVFLAGEIIKEDIPEGGSEEANAMASEILGYEPDWDEDWEDEETENEEE